MHSKRPESQELDKIAAATLAYYEARAEDFRAGTRDHDVSQNIAALLRHIKGERLSRSCSVAALRVGCGVHGARVLLSPDGIAPRTAAMAGERMAQAAGLPRHAGSRPPLPRRLSPRLRRSSSGCPRKAGSLC